MILRAVTDDMLSVAEEYLLELNLSTEIMSFGQELNDQIFVICREKGNIISDG